MYDLLIIGSGPAGLTAAIYGARGGLKTAVISGAGVGGQATQTDNIENFSGIKSVDGYTLTSTMREQAENFGAELIYAGVDSTQLVGEEKKVLCDDGKTYSAHAVIIASGAAHRDLALANEQKLIGQGVSYCATCDGGFFRKKPVAVVGGGDTALTEALYLANLCSEVFLIHRRQGFRAAQVLVERVKSNPKIKLVLDSVITELKGEPLGSVVTKNSVTGNSTEITVKGLFVAVGTRPNTAFVADEVALSQNGSIVTNSKMETNIAGVYAAGDVRETPLRQVITACADGAIAANSAIDYLNNL